MTDLRDLIISDFRLSIFSIFQDLIAYFFLLIILLIICCISSNVKKKLNDYIEYFFDTNKLEKIFIQDDSLSYHFIL